MVDYFYITTTLPYVNAKPHIGHALEFIQADAIARRQRKQGKKVIFNVGTDEHGLKMYEKAQEEWMTPQQFVDKNVETFYHFCKQFDISYDSFYRTSNPSHHIVAQHFWKQSLANGDIYEKEYSWLYCVGCESFKTTKELVNGKCPDHNKEPINYAEKNYFFRLSKYKEKLLDYIQTHKDFIIPHHKAEELKNFVKDMDDISISRHKENLPWWVPVPDDQSQVMYVWFDALTNYVGAIGYPNDQQLLASMRPWIQVCWPDNLRFQWAIWQGMLASAWLPFTQHILIHGMIMGPDGNKMSKTMGNVVDPEQQCEDYGVEAVRYYLIAGIPTFGDGTYKPDDVINIYNSHLANSFGNLLNRVIHLANQKDLNLKTAIQAWKLSTIVAQEIEKTKESVIQHYDHFELYEAANSTHQLALRANKYMDDKKPRDKSLTTTEFSQTLIDLAVLVSTIIDCYEPIIPHSCDTAKTMLEKQEKGILFNKIQ